MIIKPKPKRIAAFGATGSGKTQFVLQLIEAEKPARLMVWDYKHDPGLVGLGVPYTDLPAFIQALKARRFVVRFLPNHDRDIGAQFDAFCRAAWLAGDLTMFVDELAEVTKSNRAPPAWKKVVNVGREYTRHDGQVVGLSVIGVSQRATECDKSFVNNCDIVHCGRLGFEDDAKTMGRMLRVPPDELMNLPDLHWAEKRQGEIEPRRGVLTFKGKRGAKPTPPAKKTAPHKLTK